MAPLGLQRLRQPITRVSGHVPLPMRNATRSVARRLRLAAPFGQWWRGSRPPWDRPTPAELAAPARCNICRWTGDQFVGEAHSESALCPRCGSIARDRFLMWSFMQRDPRPADARLLETSPRLGRQYRELMRTWFDYRASDFDLSSHVGDIQLDLQQIDLPTASIDVVMTPHVLEHVPDTGRALRELFRIIAPGGRMYLQVPILHGDTRVPVEPEFHADNTPVFFNFGWDLIDQLRSAGFDVDVLVTDRFRSWLSGDPTTPSSNGDGFLIESLVERARLEWVTSVADDRQSAQLGFLPPYHFVTWECRRP